MSCNPVRSNAVSPTKWRLDVWAVYGFVSVWTLCACAIWYPNFTGLVFGSLLIASSVGLVLHAGDSMLHPLFLTLSGFILYFGIGLILIGLDERTFEDFAYFAASLFLFSLGGCMSSLRAQRRKHTFIMPTPQLNSDPSQLLTRRVKSMPSNSALYSLWMIGLIAYLFLVLRIGIPALSSDPGIRFEVTGSAASIFQVFWVIACAGLVLKAVTLGEKKSLIFALTCTVLTVFLLSMLLYRNPTLELMLALAIGLWYQRATSRTTVVLLAVGCLTIMLGVQYWRTALFSENAETNLVMILQFTGVRLFLIGAQTISYIFHAFPRPHPFLGGMTYVRVIRNLLNPSNQVPSLGYLLYSEVAASTNPGYDPVSTLGEFYVNFGTLGMFIGMLGWGYVVNCFCQRMLRHGSFYGLLGLSVGGMFLARSFAYSLPGEVFNFLLLACGFLILRVLSSRSKCAS